MINLITWLWNIRHRKLIEETEAIMWLYLFLRYDCGLRYADRLSARELIKLLDVIGQGESIYEEIGGH